MIETANDTAMIAEDFINYLIPPLKLTDNARKALNWMNEFRIHQLAVVEKGEYRGIVTDTALYNANSAQKTIQEFELDHADIYVKPHQHFYEVIKEADKHNLEIIAVLDEWSRFKGVITLRDTVKALARTYATREIGGILVLSMNKHDYSLAKIARLIEENNVKVLSSYIEPDSYDNNLMKLTLKLNQIELTRTIATLERFDYKVIAQFQEHEPFHLEKERLDLLFRYLEM